MPGGQRVCRHQARLAMLTVVMLALTLSCAAGIAMLVAGAGGFRRACAWRCAIGFRTRFDAGWRGLPLVAASPRLQRRVSPAAAMLALPACDPEGAAGRAERWATGRCARALARGAGARRRAAGSPCAEKRSRLVGMFARSVSNGQLPAMLQRAANICPQECSGARCLALAVAAACRGMS